jgi:acyl dehydratase
VRVFNDFEDLKSAVGTEIGVSDWHQVTQEQIDRFADATGDDQ